ncbi:ComF family protein [Patescibacteria group bacterium AH-259-L05]|nr:ComF family protein [Patescibacteria group bacterium AH-259-L05]
MKQYILQLVFPVKCLGCGKEHTLLCPSCINAIPVYSTPSRRQLPHCNTLLIATHYHHPLVKKTIKMAKYRPYASPLITLLSSIVIQYVKQFPTTITYISDNHFVLIPIPLSRHTYARRGFNQARYIAQELCKEFKWPVHTKLLIKVKRTPSQTELSYTSRKANIKGVFSVLKDQPLKNIILVDDVITTGATLEEAAKTLKRAGAQNVWAIVLAKS